MECDIEIKSEPSHEATPGVISLLLNKSDENDPLQDNFSDDEKVDVQSEVSADTSAKGSMSQISLPDEDMLLETSDAMQHVLDASGNTMQLDPSGGTFVQSLSVADESDSCDAPTELIDGQTVRLGDGMTAFISNVPRDGIQTVQLEDGTTVYLSRTRDELFNGEASGLDLDHLSSQICVDTNEDKEVTKMMLMDTTLKTPRASGEKSFKCLYKNCNRVYTTSHHLKVHERSHTGDRPFKCTMSGCGKAFATGYGLKSHTRVHTGETPYKCNIPNCSKAFKTSGDLQKHLRTHTGERPFKCLHPGCDRAFTTSNIRKVHMRTHTGERPYICETCHRAFASATNFKNHVRIHTGEKPYVCTFQGCNKKFTEYSSLYKHNVVHTREKPYICTLCGKHYRQTSTLATHKRTAHDIVDGTEEDFSKITELKDDEKLDNIIEFKLENDFGESTNILIEKANASHEGTESATKKLPTFIAVQSDDAANILSEHSPLYTVQLHQDGTAVTSTQQILLVADPSQLIAFQQLAQVQLHVQGILPQADEETSKDTRISFIVPDESKDDV